MALLTWPATRLTERKKVKEEDRRFRHGHVLWKAVKIALFLWVAIWIWKRCCGRRHRDTSKAGSYSKIEEGRSGPAPINDSQYASDAPATTPYGEGGVGYVPAGNVPAGKYEPMGYNEAADITDEANLAPSPLNSPDAFTTTARPVSMLSQMSVSSPSPPPYSARGAVEDYFSPPAGKTNFSPQPSPGPAAVMFPPSASREPLTETNPYAMSATYVPGRD